VADDIGDRVVRLSPISLAEESAVALDPESGPRALAAGDGSLWVANDRAGTLVEIDLASGTVVGHPIGLGSTPTDVSFGGGSLWVTSMDSDLLYRVDPEQGRVVATVEVCDGPESVVASDDAVWVACRVGRTVRHLAPDGTFVADVAIPGVPSALALDGDGVWVALRSD
jgi:streptogramin lyase